MRGVCYCTATHVRLADSNMQHHTDYNYNIETCSQREEIARGYLIAFRHYLCIAGRGSMLIILYL